jgi:hypothetical protein
MMIRFSLALAGVAAAAFSTRAATDDALPDKVEFNRDIRPIMSNTCFACHGPDVKNNPVDLRLDRFATATGPIEEGKPERALVPGKPEESEAIRRIFTTDSDDIMPPPDFRFKLSARDKAMFRKWVEQGAEYQEHWAYRPLVKPEVPSVADDGGFVRNPIDALVLARLRTENLKPSPEADAATLARRLSLDLVGLPPDGNGGTHEEQVERLLASPHYGERMAVPWLDIVRFADTVGYHGDQQQNIFPYRDYVIDAFNKNKPFDQFTIEQLAGDLLPHATVEQKVATGFNRLNMMTREGGAQPKEYLAKYDGDRVRTVSNAWMGSTMACCECHDHKFDPFKTRDFYRLGAFFADIRQWGVYADYGYTPEPELKGVNNESPFPPEIEVESPYLVERIGKLEQRMETLATVVAKNDYGDWRSAMELRLAGNPDGWKVAADPKVTAAKGSMLHPAEEGSWVVEGKKTAGEKVVFTFPVEAGPLAALRIEVLPNAEHGGRVTREGAGAFSIKVKATLGGGQGTKARVLDFRFAEANLRQARYSQGIEILNVAGNWMSRPGSETERHAALYFLKEPLTVGEGAMLTVEVESAEAGCLRVSTSPFGGREAGVDARDYVLSTAADQSVFGHLVALQDEIRECREGRTFTMVTEARPEPREMRVLARGDWQDTNGEIANPGVPEFLPQIPNPDGRRLNRLDLARWLVAPENPLTARVFVNRLWKRYFGTGISAVLDDLGSQGEWPVHPELLDWLAAEFRDSGWNVKHIVRLIVTSSTYRQSSDVTPDLLERDPKNRLLARQSPRRLEAEFVRDNALALSGLIDPSIGGPSGHPYQPAGYYVNLNFPERDYPVATDDRQYRRGVYTHWQRTFLHPMLANFDAPSREECTAERTVSNTPQQALTLLNDPSFVEAARVLAEKVTAEGVADVPTMLDRLAYRVLGRPLRDHEKGSLTEFHARQLDYYKGAPEDAGKLLSVGLSPHPDPTPELATWTSVARVFLNLHETITRY